MKIFLASTNQLKQIREKSLYNLDSYIEFYNKFNKPSDHLKFKDYLLDSGAFTFMNNKPSNLDWDHYIDSYADYVRTNKIKNYFELDIDVVVGYNNVLKFRDKLESKVGWQSIPVWHIERGKEAFKEICKSHKYIAIGGMVNNRKARNLMSPYYKLFIDEAHRNNTKIHGLGYTSLNGLKQHKFDSVDSTSWLAYGKFGCSFYIFNGHGFDQIKKQKNQLRKNYFDEAKDFNLSNSSYHHYIQGLEWLKFQKYAENNL